MAEEKKSRSGTSRSYATRAAKGRPNVTFALPTDLLTLITELAEHHKLSRSGVVELAIRELHKKIR